MTEVVNTVRNDRSALLDNSAGTVVKYAYDAFGNCKVLETTICNNKE